MDTLKAICTRTSVSFLAEPGPTDAQLALILQAAARAPDHGRLRPWRFVLVRGEARQRLGDVLAEATRLANPDAPAPLLDRERQKPLRAPVILVVAVTLQQHRTVPEIEQILAGGAAVQNSLLAAHALGLGAMWRTGDKAYDGHVKQALGLPPNSAIIGFIYLGKPASDVRRKPGEHSVTAVEWGESPRDFIVPLAAAE
jgi:nitroreductase